ncbi:cupin domain-containing protein [Pseudomonas sp. NY15437]|uniref:cupin domain-containing protein n=1 Tax=Pseudomonas sp. NY15437 TaxID=3400360 RepID=UPI003A83C693
MPEFKAAFFNGESTAPHIRGARDYDDLVDWGVQSDALEGVSHSSGRLLFKGPNNSPETGVWVCTPGRWRLSIPRDELCHFVSGRATYRSDAGEVIEVEPDTLVLFPAGWTGECTVHSTIRNLYMLA